MMPKDGRGRKQSAKKMEREETQKGKTRKTYIQN